MFDALTTGSYLFTSILPECLMQCPADTKFDN